MEVDDENGISIYLDEKGRCAVPYRIDGYLLLAQNGKARVNTNSIDIGFLGKSYLYGVVIRKESGYEKCRVGL